MRKTPELLYFCCPKATGLLAVAVLSKRSYSSMDRISDSGSEDLGSSPDRIT
jgi:hypothetical protein